MSSKDLLYIGLIAFVFLIIIGLYVGEYSPLNISEKERILKEEFSNPSKSTTVSQSKGASQYFKWGLPENNVSVSSSPPKKECTKQDDDIPPFSPKPIEPDCIHEEKKTCTTNFSDPNCYTCDITKNKDISNYVLKSSVPPCQDVSNYATKNMIQSCPDISKYILKSEIPSCEKIDKSKYILKSEVPACPKCPICPICPICPTCPKPQKCKTINQYKISEHRDSSNYIHKDDIDKHIKDNKLCKNLISEEIKYNKDKVKDESQKHKEDKMSKLDKIFAETSDLRNSSSNLQGAYAGDNLFAVF